MAKDPITRFELFVILRNQVKDRRRVQRALAVEAAMEELAAALGEDVSLWAIAGLGADIDVELTAQNPGRRGAMAAELLRTEGAPEAAAIAAIARLADDEAAMPRLAAAIAAAEALVDDVYAALAAGDRLDQLEAFALARRLERAAERRGDEAAARLLRLCARLSLELERLATLTLTGMRRVREDLRL